MITLISTSVEIVLLEMKHCNQHEEPLMSIAEIKEPKSSRIAFSGEMHFSPKPPLSMRSILALQSQGCSQSEGLAFPCMAPAEMLLIPHILQPCFPQCARGVPLVLSSGQTLWHPWLSCIFCSRSRNSWPPPVLEKLPAALCLLQGPSFQSLLPC